MNKDIFESKYKNILLGCRNSKSKTDYFIEDFLDRKILIDFIISTCDNESDFTKEGFEFIEEYYGLDVIVRMVLEEYPEYPFEENLSPMDVLLSKKKFALEILV